MDLMDGTIMVRVLPDSSLAMSVVDGNKQYTLLPSNHTVCATAIPARTCVPQAPMQSVGTEPCTENRSYGVQSHGAQAVDGRYASVYQLAHCNVLPTSPPVQLAEFPPQRAELSRGQCNFEVGGIGSGETNGSPTRTSQCYRGAMNWPDKSVYTPRQPAYHYEHDSFAESLRKYPSLSPERSQEIVERLINYTQMKASTSKQISRNAASPTRSEAPCPGLERRGCVSALLRTKAYEPDINVRPKVLEESPTRDTCKKVDYEPVELKKSLYTKNYDLRCHRDMTRRAKESVRSVSTYPYNHTVCPPIQERYDHLPPKNNLLGEHNCVNSVHMETQAEIPMVSKEVATVPRAQPLMRNVAVPLSPSASESAKVPNKVPERSRFLQQSVLESKLSHKSIQTVIVPDRSIRPRKSVQTCNSSIDVANKKIVKTCRKSKSEEEIRINDSLEQELYKAIRDLSLYSDVDSNFCVKNGVLRKLRRLYKAERNDRVKIKLGRCVKDQLGSHLDLKHFTKELSNELLSKIEAKNIIHKFYDTDTLLKADAAEAKSHSDNCVEEFIKECLDDIPVKPVDYLGRPVKKEQVLQAVVSKIKWLIINNLHNRCGSLRSEILDILEDIPTDINSRNKNYFLKRIASDIVKKIKDVFSNHATNRKRWQKAIDLDKTLINNLRNEAFAYTYILPTDTELKQFVKQEFKEFTKKFNVIICPSTEKNIEIELIDILTDCLNALKYGQDERVKEEIVIMLSDFINISENEGIYFANNLIYNFKDILKDLHTGEDLPQTFIVSQNTVQNLINQNDDNSDNRTKDQDVSSNLNTYTQQIVEQINKWMSNIKGLNEVDAGFKQVVAQDLAEDIVDRHKYLELNPSSKRSDADELEHLKFQIFKWVNKLTGEDNLETIEHALKLMQIIQNIPVPMPTRPVVIVQNADTCNPSCFKKDQGPTPNTQRRCSSRGEMLCVKPEANNDKRKQSCCKVKRNEGTKCCSTDVDTKDHAVLTDSGQNQIQRPCNNPTEVPTPPEKNTAYTATEMVQIPKTCPRGTSMCMVKFPEVELSRNRKYSEPSGFSSYTNTRPAEQKPTTARPLCCEVDSKDCNPTPTMKDLNDEFDLYLQNWVSQIPIITSNPKEQALIDTMRKGIYNGVWKARAKLQMNPNAVENHFYYQDLLDDELEELLDLLPQSSELTKNKQMLKNQLIEKMANMNEQMRNFTAPPSYKQQLIDNVGSHIPRKTLGFASSDVSKTCEDIHKLNLAETFIMFTLYRFKDNVKANVYKKKLMKQIQEFFDNLKRTQGLQAKDMDFNTYKDEIMNALYTVPQPGDTTMREEGNEVLIGLEIEQWFSDLPLYPTDNNFEVLCRKRYRDTLTKKVHDIEKENNLACSEEELRHEITRFMGKLPLREGEIQNMPFMVEELVNRLKNRPKDLVEGSEKRKLMPLISPYDYDEFSRDMPLCSSFSDAPGARRAQINESSYLIRGGERAEDKYSPIAGQINYVQQRGDLQDSIQDRQTCPGAISNRQWHSLQEDRTPQAMQTCAGINYNRQWQTLQEDGASHARQTCADPSSNQQRQSLCDDRAPQARHTSPCSNNQHWQSLHDDGASQAKQMSPCSNSNQQWQSLHDDGAPPARLTDQGEYPSAQNPPGSCRLQDFRNGTIASQSIAHDQSYREADSRMRGGSIRREQSPSRLQETTFSGSVMGRAVSPNPRLSGRSSQSRPHAARLQETYDLDSFAEQATSPHLRCPGRAPPEQPYTSRLKGTHISGTRAEQPSSTHQRSPTPASGIRCPRSREYLRGPMDNSPDGSPFPSVGPETSSRAYDGLRPGTSQEPFNSHEMPSGFSRQPVGTSTPQQDGPPPRVSRPKKRIRQINRPRRDAARKRLEMTDSDESGSDEVQCRCMERIWRCRKKRSGFTPCEECDIDFPPCFPMRFPYPFYF